MNYSCSQYNPLYHIINIFHLSRSNLYLHYRPNKLYHLSISSIPRWSIIHTCHSQDDNPFLRCKWYMSSYLNSRCTLPNHISDKYHFLENNLCFHHIINKLCWMHSLNILLDNIFSRFHFFQNNLLLHCIQNMSS